MSFVLETDDLEDQLDAALDAQDGGETVVLEAEEETDVEDVDIGDDDDDEEFDEFEPEESEPPADPPAAVGHDDSDDDDESRDILHQIWNAEMRCRGKEAIVEDLKEQLKEAKASYDLSVKNLRKLATQSNCVMPLFDRRAPVAAEPVARVVEQEPVEVEPAVDDSWRSRSFDSFIRYVDIKGFGGKKLDAISSIFETFGDFEDMRTRASLEGCHLSHLLPAGFGESITDQIENAYLSAITDEMESEAEPDDSEPDEVDLDPNEAGDDDGSDDELVSLEDL